MNSFPQNVPESMSSEPLLQAPLGELTDPWLVSQGLCDRREMGGEGKWRGRWRKCYRLNDIAPMNKTSSQS